MIIIIFCGLTTNRCQVNFLGNHPLTPKLRCLWLRAICKMRCAIWLELS